MIKKILKWVLIAFIAFIAIGVIAVVTESDEAKEKREARQEERKEQRQEEKEENEKLKQKEEKKEAAEEKKSKEEAEKKAREDDAKKQAEKEKKEKTDKEKKSKKEKKKDKKPNPEKEIKDKLKDKFGDDLLSVKGVFDSEPYFTQIELMGSENLTQNMTVKGMYMDIKDAVYIIKEQGYEFENLGVSVKFPLVDQYGNQSDEYVIKSDFSGDTIKKLSEDKYNVLIENVPTIADEWWEHPALSN